LVRRALLLVGPGELQELQQLRVPENTKGICDYIQSMVEEEDSRSYDGVVPPNAPVCRAIASLRAINTENGKLPLGLLGKCAATLTEMQCGWMSFTNVQDVLPRCVRLESLTWSRWLSCPPTAWLGLSQLHTLRGVSLAYVPAADIAAALPRLHTLHLYHARATRNVFPVAAFFDELLPRLRSFHLEGFWPETSDTSETEPAVVHPLPLLEDLKWCGEKLGLPRQLMGARPSTLHIDDTALDDWLRAAEGADADPLTVASPLARVRVITLRFEATPVEAASMARLLRAAPQLRKFAFDVCFCIHVGALWFLSDEFTPDTVVAGLFHPRLRQIAISSAYIPVAGVHPAYNMREPDVPVPDGCGVRLRQRHFPRLRRFTANDEEYPV
jgi:hypothetical protein